jgi:hypothetical protein
MWELPEELEIHFEWVKEQRGSGHQERDDDQIGGAMMQNEYARGRGRESR